MHFSGHPDTDEDGTEIVTPPMLESYFDYLSTLHFDGAVKEIYLLDMFHPGVGGDAFKSILRAFWKKEFKRDLPALHILSMLYCFNSFIKEHNLTVKETYPDNRQIFVPEPNEADNHSWTVTELVSEKHIFPSGLATRDIGLYNLYETFAKDNFQIAGGIFFDCDRWLQERTSLFKQPVLKEAAVHMNQILDLTYKFVQERNPNSDLTEVANRAILQKLKEETQKLQKEGIGQYRIPLSLKSPSLTKRGPSQSAQLPEAKRIKVGA